MKYGIQFAGIVVGALGVAVLLRGIYHSGGPAMIVPGACAAAAGTWLIFRGHYRGR